jgi:hypothetical protein
MNLLQWFIYSGHRKKCFEKSDIRHKYMTCNQTLTIISDVWIFGVKTRTHTICSKCTLFVRRIHHKHMTYNQMLKIRQTCAFQKGMICTKCTLLAHSIFKVFVMGGKIFPFSFWSRKDSHECNAACEQNYAFLCHRSKV